METKDVQNDKMQEDKTGRLESIAQERDERGEEWLHAVSPQQRDCRGEQWGHWGACIRCISGVQSGSRDC
jgi:hypothetical protein